MLRRDVAKDMQWKSKWPRNVVENDLILGTPKPRREERHVIKKAPKALSEERMSTVECAQEYSVGSVQGKAVTSLLNAQTNILAALMGKGHPNSIVSVTATNIWWGKATNGTRTQVVTCLTSRWKVRIKWEGLYNVRISPWKKGEGGNGSNNRNHVGHVKKSLLE